MGPDEDAIVSSVRRAVGDVPVVLFGSRAAGTATAGSDWDVFVLLPLWRIPTVMRRLAGLEQALTAQLGAPVTLSPFPRFRLQRPGGSLVGWKLRAEGRVLAAPAGFGLPPAGPPPLDRRRSASYALSGLRYALAGREDKARAHAALLASGTAPDDPVPTLLAYARPRRGGALQYAALSALRGRPRLPRRARRKLDAAVIALARGDEAAAWHALPRALRPPERSRAAILAVVEREWPQADPLAGL